MSKLTCIPLQAAASCWTPIAHPIAALLLCLRQSWTKLKAPLAPDVTAAAAAGDQLLKLTSYDKHSVTNISRLIEHHLLGKLSGLT